MAIRLPARPGRLSAPRVLICRWHCRLPRASRSGSPAGTTVARRDGRHVAGTKATAKSCHRLRRVQHVCRGNGQETIPADVAAIQHGLRRVRSSHAPAGRVRGETAASATAARAEPPGRSPSMVRRCRQAVTVTWLREPDTVRRGQSFTKMRCRHDGRARRIHTSSSSSLHAIGGDRIGP